MAPTATHPEPTPRSERDQMIASHSVLWLSPAARERLVFIAVGFVMIIAGGLVAAVNGAAAFAHASWLAAYLVLVGGVAQIALGVGCLTLPEPHCPPRLRALQLGLWNIGVLGVAAGVLANLFGVVLGGCVVVAGALVCFAAGSGPADDPGRTRVLAYRLLIAALAISVLVGGVLAHGHPAS